MPFNLFPKSPKFFDLFREQNRIIVEAMTLLHSMAQEFEKMDVRGQMINRLESEGDVISREISHQLSTTFITPIDREDIHQINVSQETILNHIQAISNRICVYGLTRVRFPAQRMVSNLKDMVLSVGTMVGMLDRKVDATEPVKRVKYLKKECEMLLLSGLGELYDNPDPTPAEVMDIIKWTHVYDRIEKAFNRTWQLAKAIEGIVLKNA
jgi:uncharacterized protein Yka (UPF0111/DUF47 family)